MSTNVLHKEVMKELSSLEALGLSALYLGSFYQKFCTTFERFLPITVIASFVAGVFIASVKPSLAIAVGARVNGFVDMYSLLAPVIIFIILAPSLARIAVDRNGKQGKFMTHAFTWLSLTRFLSLVWAVIFTWIVFDLSFLGGYSNIYSSVKQTFGTLLWMATHSAYFYAMYLSVAVVFIAKKFKVIEVLLRKMLMVIEDMGQFLVPIIPLFMFAIGVYIYQLPDQMNSQLGDAGGAVMQPLTFLGISMETNTATDMVIVYGVISLIIGIACFIFHMGLVFWASYKVEKFSIKHYFTKYWVNVYPLLWATSSEALATPLNLYLVRRHFPWVRSRVRHFAVGVGSYLGINGTMICVIVLAGAVASILDIEISAVQMFMAIPLVFLIGFGVPGIPGELLLFGGPLVQLFGFPPETTPLFLAVYLGLQIGLPDSFRTGSNSTDNAVMAVLFNDMYEKKYHDDDIAIDMLLDDASFKQVFARRLQDRLLPAQVPVKNHEDLPQDYPLFVPQKDKRKVVKERRKFRSLYRRAADLAALHAVLSSSRGDFYRFRLLQLLETGKSMAELESQRASNDVEELHRHVNMLQKFSLIEEVGSNGSLVYRRTESGEKGVNALRALGRRVNEDGLLKILQANFGVNSIHLFLNAYGYKKDVDFQKPEFEFTPLEIGQITMSIPRTIEGVSAIDKLGSAEILVYSNDGKIRMNSQKARALFQYWDDLLKIQKGGAISHKFFEDQLISDLSNTTTKQ